MNCKTCGRELNTLQISSLDCGGDCMACMADWDDPDCKEARAAVIEECNEEHELADPETCELHGGWKYMPVSNAV